MGEKGRTPMCHFFRLGTCNKGSGCAFSHDLAHPDSFLCPYFLKGTCIYGDKCQYDHRMPVGTSSKRSNEASTSASTDTAPSSVTAPSSGSTSNPKPKPAQKQDETAGDHKPPEAPGSLAASAGTDCVYFRSGSCRFGNQCRFRHEAAQTDSEAAIASLGNQMLNLNTGKAAPRTKAASKASPSGTQAAAGAPAAPAAKKTAWGQRKNRQAPASGLTVYDDNQDTSDPWFRSQNPYLIPERTKMPQVENSEILCVTYTMTGECSYGDKCPFMHGELCETCGSHCLHPTDEAVRNEHITACAEMLKATEAHARSKHKECGICLETVLSKEDPAARRFGLLACEHCFCLQCIRSWRGSAQADESATRACPTCRTLTFFITPSSIWPQSTGEKQGIIDGYKDKLGRTHCKHFLRGAGTCPFGSSCFYRHEFKDGTLQDRGALPADTRFASGADGCVRPMQEPTLSSFLEGGRIGRRLRQR